MKSVLVTGANRGLGLEFCKQYVQQGWKVFACCRSPEQAEDLNRLLADYSNIQIFKLDVLDRKGIDVLAQQLSTESLDLLIANAGVYGDNRGQGFRNLDYANWITTLETNLLGVVKVTEAFFPQLKQSESSQVVAISSLMGSMGDNSSGGCLLYRSSKAALNAAMKSLSIDLRSQGIGVTIFHPGWVRTDMGGPSGLIDAETSVKGMIKQITDFKISATGQFIKYDGSPLLW